MTSLIGAIITEVSLMLNHPVPIQFHKTVVMRLKSKASLDTLSKEL